MTTTAKYILIFAVTAFLIFLILVSMFLFRKTPGTITGPTPTITLVPTITPRPTDLFISSVLPPQNTPNAYLPIQKITITFSEEVEPAAVKLLTEPSTEVLLRKGGANVVYIVPREKWVLGETKIRILKETTSKSGKKLYTPYFYSLFVDIPPAPEIEYDHP